MDSDDHDRAKSISEGIRRGLVSPAPDPLPSRLEELLRELRNKEQPPEAANGQAPPAPAPAAR